MIIPPRPTSNISLFDQTFDVAVIGAGFVGIAAREKLMTAGIGTVLVEPTDDLLWEATRALENSTAASDPAPNAWQAWLGPLRARDAANSHAFEPALAEILTAAQLKGHQTPHRVLLQAPPVGIEQCKSLLTGVIVATKSGARRIRARHWIDATEDGLLLRLCVPTAQARRPDTLHRSLVIHANDPTRIDAVCTELKSRHPGLEVLTGPRTTERRLRWPVNPAIPWHRQVRTLLTDLRELIPDEGAPDFTLSHCGMRDFPSYAAADQPGIDHSVDNLTVLSPAFRREPLATPSERFSLGHSLTIPVIRPLPSAADNPPPAVLPEPAAPERVCTVLVAGAGTAGAVAAIAAARHGASTLAIDSATSPGGIGTGAGISGYFHGAAGGLQDEIDLRTQEMTRLSQGFSPSVKGWHHDAKKIALLELFDEAGVSFSGGTLLCGVQCDADGHVSSVLAVIEDVLTRIAVCACIDSTGDGDLCAQAGATFTSGRPGDQRTLAYSQSAFFLNQSKGRPYVQSCNFDAGWVDPTDPETLTQARLTGLAQHLDSARGIPLAMAPMLGLRQSRQIETDLRITHADLVAGRCFEDVIGEVKSIADTHSVDFEFETDEMAFYYWTCRGFRHALRSELPYRMLLPRGLNNVWIACRAAGITVEAAYGLRMQREMQRLGEVAGIASALATTSNRSVADSRTVEIATLQARLALTGALPVRTPPEASSRETWLAALDQGRPGIHLWHLYQDGPSAAGPVSERLHSSEPRVSFYAAALLAMWGMPEGERRLIAALKARETGPLPEEFPVPGAFAQCIDLPFWLQSVVLLRRIATPACLQALSELARETGHPHNIRTILALTVEALAARLGTDPALIDIFHHLSEQATAPALLPPSRSLWRTLHAEDQKKLVNDIGADTHQDHAWQLQLILDRTAQQLGQHERHGNLSPEGTLFSRIAKQS